MCSRAHPSRSGSSSAIGQRLRFAQVLEEGAEVIEGHERPVEVEPQIDRELPGRSGCPGSRASAVQRLLRSTPSPPGSPSA